MKKTKKHNIKNISFFALAFSALCLAGCNAVESSNSNVVEETPKAYIMQKQNKVMPKKTYGDNITLLGDYTYEDIVRVFVQCVNMDVNNMPTETTYYVQEGFAGTYGSSTVITEARYTISAVPHGVIEYSLQIEFNYSNRPTMWTLAADMTQETVTADSTAVLTSYPENFYNAINNVPPPPPSMGEQIVDGIESGLGMIGTIASEFLAGFGALFYVNNQLTPFAIFSLVFLGIAITFAIIKLCLNVVRSNTGA